VRNGSPSRYDHERGTKEGVPPAAADFTYTFGYHSGGRGRSESRERRSPGVVPSNNSLDPGPSPRGAWPPGGRGAGRFGPAQGHRCGPTAQ
jgi:hypothetical protein